MSEFMSFCRDCAIVLCCMGALDLSVFLVSTVISSFND